MQQLARPTGLGLPSPRSQRSSSISNDRASLSVASLPFPPAVSPDPAYIAPSSASQIVTGDHEPTLDEEDEDEETDGPWITNAFVAPTALSLVNAFLDQLLYSFLACARSTSIAALRPAVTEVLKPRLAKDAIASADAELQEFLGGEDDDALSIFHHGLEPRGSWDLNTIWRRTRLRCMVYTRLGDLEEEDEEMWVERENLDQKAVGRNRLSRDLGVVSPAAAIFLTSILEFIGEQVLLISGKAAYGRFEARRRQERHNSASANEFYRPSVEVVDIEKLAVNTTFGRLWRSWKKKVRSPSIASQRPSSREIFLRPASSMSTSESRSRKASIGDSGELLSDPSVFRRPSTAEDRERTFEAAAVPLPATADDTSEVEGSRGPARASREDPRNRPHSMMMPTESGQATEKMNGLSPQGPPNNRRMLLQRNRSSSLPSLTSRGYFQSGASFLLTPEEGPSFSTSQDSTNRFPNYDVKPSAVTTVYDGLLLREEGAQTGNKNEASIGFESPAWKQGRTELENEYDGFDEPAKAPDSRQPFSEEIPAGLAQAHPVAATQDNRTDSGERSPFKFESLIHDSSSAGPNEKKQALPPRIESRLDSKRMQGYVTENVSLENRETSIVESTPRQPLQSELPTRRLKDEAPRLYDIEDEDAPAELKNPSFYAKHDSLDGASSTTRDFNASQYGAVPKSHPDSPSHPSSAAPNQSPTFGQSRLPATVSDIRKQLPPVSTGVERAAVQRVSPSPGSALESPIGRTSTSSNRDIRPLHTSGSINSQKATKARSLVGRDSSDISRQFAASRTSSEGSGSIAVKTPRIDETERSFEQLINSEETIQYTLTPQSVREMDVSDELG